MNADFVELIRGSQSILFQTGYQYGWYLSEFQDWLGTSDDKIGTTERPQAHGAFDVTRSLRTAKTPSFRVGHNSMGDAAAVEAAIDELSAIGADGPVTMRVGTQSGVSERVVTIQVTHLDVAGLATGSVAVDCVARDPRRYDVNVQSASTTPAQAGQGRTWPAVWPLVWPGGGSSGRITLTNTGKAPSAPTFILEGGFDTALITCLETGARIGLNRQVPVGSQVVIDTKTRRATIDGQSDVSRWLQYREWELIPPGASRTYQFDATGVVSDSTLVARNLATNPSFETGGSTVEVARNRYIAAGIGLGTGTGGNAGILVNTDLYSGGYAAVTPGEVISLASFGLPGVRFQYGFTTTLPAAGGTATGWVNAGNSATTAANITVPAGAAYVVLYLSNVNPQTQGFITTAGTDAFRWLFDGSGSPDPDLVASWTGTPGASPSILTGTLANTPMTGAAWSSDSTDICIRSTRWANGGAYSARMMSTVAGASSYRYIVISGLAAGVYTVIIPAYLATAQSSPGANARTVEYRIGAATQAMSAPFANAPGPQEFRLTFTKTAAAGAHLIMINQRVPRGDADLWLDDFTIVAGAYEGPAFSGRTPPSGQDSYSWEGPPDASPSVATRTTIHAILEGQVRSAWW